MSRNQSGRYAEQIYTIRDIYYIDPEFFRVQCTVDRIVDDLAYTIGVNRTALNVVCSTEFSRTSTARLGC
jgi:meiotic recombination protein SPO11